MEVPNDYKTAGIFVLASGILNTLTASALVLSLIWFFCVGLLWVPVLVVGIFEIVTGLSMMQGQPRHNGQLVAGIGLVAALLCGNLISIVLEILALVWLGKPEVKGWLDAA